MIPRLGEPIHRDRRYRLRPGAYVILPRGRDILLTVQWNDGPDMQLPGGGIDQGEPLLPALYREVMEETGWSMSQPIRLGAFRRFVYMPEYDLWAEKLCHIFLAHPARQIRAPSEPDHTVVWMPLTQAVHDLGNAADRWFLGRHSARIGRLASGRARSSVVDKHH